ncbi:MAG TPA: TonB-dependent receptor, partial [Bacteroidia bacterium]|nr:TonB-dependent receptor [Bacteroidia bacterium]
MNSKNTLKFGFNSTYHQMSPGDFTLVVNSQATTLNLSKTYSWENALYLSHVYKPASNLNFEYGLRLTMFSVLGPGVFYSYNTETAQVTDSSVYKSNEIVKTYINPEPRFAANYILNEVSSVKASYARNVQNIHLLNNSTSEDPTAAWLPSTNYVKPEISDQVSLGYFRNFKDNMFEFSAEVYYKTIHNVVDFKDNAQLQLNQNNQSQLLFGQGRAYGVEFLLKKKYGRFNGWIGYTLSRAEQQINGINNNKWYLSSQDRTHDISVVVIYQLAKKWTVSSTFVYYTGSPVTFPSGKYQIDNETFFYYTERNGYRMPAYDRLDVGVTWRRKKTEKFESSWTFSIYNVYDRMNAYTISFRQNPDNVSETQAVQTSLFGIIPSISYNFKF